MGINWRKAEEHPLCTMIDEDSGEFEINIDEVVAIEVPIYRLDQYRNKRRSYEYYFATVDDDGEMRDMSEQTFGISWDDVSRWCPLSELV